MSPSWHERIHAVLMPDRIAVRRFARGLTPRLAATEDIAIKPAADGSTAIGALGDCLGRWKAKNVRIEIVLSNEFARYAVLPGGELFDHAQRLSLARIVFRRTYGAVADAWTLSLSPTRSNEPTLACGLDTAFLATLRDTVAAHGRLTSLRPVWMDAVNRYRRQLAQGQGYFVVAEPGRLTIACLHKGAWRQIVSRSLPARREEAEQILAEHLALTETDGPRTLWLCDLTGSFRPQVANPWTLVTLPLATGVHHAGDALAMWEAN